MTRAPAARAARITGRRVRRTPGGRCARARRTRAARRREQARSRRARSRAAGCRARSRSGGDRRRPVRLAQERAATRRARAAADPSAATIGIAARRSASPTCSNSSTPDGDRKHLKPRTPARASGSSSPALPGTTPPQNADVHVASSSRRRALRLKPCDRRRRRNAVERHVDERRDAAGRRRARRMLEAFPLGAARIVDVHVRIDEPRKDDVARPRRSRRRRRWTLVDDRRPRRCGPRGCESPPAACRPAARRARFGRGGGCDSMGHDFKVQEFSIT